MNRLRNAVVTLVATLAVYQGYVWSLVPLIEPPLVTRPFDPVDEAEWQGGAAQVRRYQDLLRAYLPDNHWALTGTPQVYEYAHKVMLVLEDFRPIGGDQVELTKAVVVAFPTPRVPGEPPPRDAILLEAPDSSIIRFDEFDPGLSFASGKKSRPIGGVFPGKLIVRSDMDEPGPQDDLYLETRDVVFDQSKFRTEAEVRLQVGPHQASGRGLEVLLTPEPHAGASEFAVAGVDSLEVFSEVRALIATTDLGIGPSRPQREPGVSPVTIYDRRPTIQLAANETPIDAPIDAPINAEPLELTCNGSFRFDFNRFMGAFTEGVEAVLPRPDAMADRMFCRELRLHFSDEQGRSLAIDPDEEPELARRQGRALGRLRPNRVEALGGPVRLESPGRRAALRGNRLQFSVGRKRFRIEGAPATIVQGLSEARAPLLEYEEAPAGAGVVGDFTAAGPGWLRLTPSEDRPDRSYQAHWKSAPGGAPSVTVRRDARGDPVLKIVGRPEFGAVGLGKLRADQLVAPLREVAADGPDGPAIELDDSGGALLVRRVDALGAVEFAGREFEGRCESLSMMVRPIESADGAAGTQLTAAPNGSERSVAVAPSKRYRLGTRTIQVDVGWRGDQVTPVALACDGGVRIDEISNAPPEDRLRVIGQQLRADRLDRQGESRMTLAGAPDGPAGDPHDGLAELQAKGFRVWVRDLHLDQAAGRAWTEGRGDAVVRLPSGPKRPGGEATLRWRGGMVFDGKTIAVSNDVFGETAEGWISCQRLAATLRQPIDLGRGLGSFGSGREEIDIETVAGSGGVTIDYRTADEVGRRSHERAELDSLQLNRTTGDLAGAGPGSIRSVRLGGGGLLADAKPNASGLNFLRLDFRDEVTGNINDRRLRFVGAIESVYGPVLDWDRILPLHSPDGLPPDAVELRCAELLVFEDPAASLARGAGSGLEAPLGPVEMKALGGVRIDAAIGEEGGMFVAEASSGSYSQTAERAVLEGDAQQLARLWIRTDATQQFTPTVAGRLTYYIRDRITQVSDLRGVNYQLPPSAARPRPAAR